VNTPAHVVVVPAALQGFPVVTITVPLVLRSQVKRVRASNLQAGRLMALNGRVSAGALACGDPQLRYGSTEIVGGFLARSQALKADALDFLGTVLSPLSDWWPFAAASNGRVSSALIQAVFLGVTGLGIFAATAYRVFAQQTPEGETMGLLGIVALAVNVGAELILMPHRQGDANVSAVWLFSRNDASGNLAVVVAAGFVAWTQTAWPDLIVAAIVAGLFLHSAWSIFRDARHELKQLQPAEV
jgi:Co/Zn/Cd efflux system component